jgi:hypothetical protein
MGQQQQQMLPGDQAQLPPLNLTITDLTKTKVYVKVKPSTKFYKIMDVYAAHKGVEVTTLRFWFGEGRLAPHKCPADLKMEDGDDIFVMMEQVGC